MDSPRRGRLFLPILLSATLLALAVPPTAVDAQVAGSEAHIDVSSDLVRVMVSTLAPAAAGEPAVHDTERLLISLASDPTVAAVLSEMGAGELAPRYSTPPSEHDLARLQRVLAGGAPRWLAEAIEVSVEMDLSSVTPLNVLLVLVRDPDAATVDFLDRYGLNGTALEARASEVLSNHTGAVG